MAFEPVFETINYNFKQGEVFEQIKAECKTDISTETVSSVLNVSCWSVINECGVEDGKINYSGKVIFYVSYLDSDGAIRKTECGNEFTGSVKDESAQNGCRAFATVTVEKTETDVSGIKLSLSAYLSVKAEITGCAEIKALSGGENLVVDTLEVPCVKSLGVRHGTYPIEEEFELNYPVSEVLSHRAEAVITAVQCGVGAIIVDGEVLLSAIMLQKNDKRDIIKETRNIPFRMEIDCEEAMPSMQATARVKEKSFKTDVTVDEDGGKSIVGASAVLKFEGEAFTVGSVSVAKDAFSTEQELELEQDRFPYYKTCEVRTLSSMVSGKAVIEELPVGVVALAVCGEKAEITSTVCNENRLSVTGIVNGVGFFRDGDGKPFTRKIEIPFETLLDATFDCNVELDVIVKAVKARIKILSLTELDFETEMIFTVYPKEKCELKYVKSIKAVGNKPVCESAISVYIPTEGEDLWSLAKRLNVCPDALVNANKDLCFPLTGNERIVIYRQK